MVGPDQVRAHGQAYPAHADKPDARHLSTIAARRSAFVTALGLPDRSSAVVPAAWCGPSATRDVAADSWAGEVLQGVLLVAGQQVGQGGEEPGEDQLEAAAIPNFTSPEQALAQTSAAECPRPSTQGPGAPSDAPA